MYLNRSIRLKKKSRVLLELHMISTFLKLKTPSLVSILTEDLNIESFSDADIISAINKLDNKIISGELF